MKAHEGLKWSQTLKRKSHCKDNYRNPKGGKMVFHSIGLLKIFHCQTTVFWQEQNKDRSSQTQFKEWDRPFSFGEDDEVLVTGQNRLPNHGSDLPALERRLSVCPRQLPQESAQQWCAIRKSRQAEHCAVATGRAEERLKQTRFADPASGSHTRQLPGRSMERIKAVGRTRSLLFMDGLREHYEFLINTNKYCKKKCNDMSGDGRHRIQVSKALGGQGRGTEVWASNGTWHSLFLNLGGEE